MYKFAGLFSRYPVKMNVLWSSVVKNSSTNEYTIGSRTGHQLLFLQQQNHTFKVFDILYSELKRTNMSKRRALSLKMDLLNEYAHPTPFPTDMFLRLPNGSPNQAYIMLAQVGTGKMIITRLSTIIYA